MGEWVVEDVVEPRPGGDQGEYYWGVAWPLGRGMENGEDAVALIGLHDFESGASQDPYRTLEARSGWRRSPVFTMNSSIDSGLLLQGGWEASRLEILDAPSGMRVVGFSLSLDTLAVYDLKSGSLLGTIDYPPPPPGQPQLHAWRAIYNAGDLNGDGWDDLFAEGAAASYAFSAAIDGRSLAATWVDYVADQDGSGPLIKYGSGGFPDLDGDGVEDFVASVPLFHGATMQREHRVRALSGASGEILWERSLPTASWFVHGTYADDVDGDGVSDLIVVSRDGEVRALGGAAGNTIWSQDAVVATPYLPPGITTVYPRHPSVVHSRPDPRRDVRQVSVRLEYFGHVGGLFEHAWMHLDASDGVLLDVTFPPDDLKPWNGDALEPSHAWSSGAYGMGDVDRDGTIEVIRHVEAPGLDNPNLPTTPMHFAVLGLRTLVAPDAMAVGDVGTFECAIPSGGGRPAFLALSQGFDADGGAAPAGWPTFLALDGLASTTLRNRPFSRTLGAHGDAVWSVAVPNNPALVGRTLYSKVLVPDLVNGGVYTHSTLGVTEITP